MSGSGIGAMCIALATTLALLVSGPVALAADVPTGVSQGAPAASERKQIELALALGKFKARDRHGVMMSLYQGKWFMPKREKVRRCITKRESGANYRAVSAGGRYRGAYQMSRRLAVGASWMMQREVRKELGADAEKIVIALRNKPTQRWNRYWQDRAFWTIWHKGKGKSHWRGGAHDCMTRR
ncbi:MAG: hypothetical protein EXQ60_07150 [Candidatus Nanopelagicales bacterium]|nr:hypothetical protein [Candidatus Nanopelagicales bacterium]